MAFKIDAYLSKEEVRELAGQLPKETLEKLVESKEDTEQQKVSDCCGGKLVECKWEEICGKHHCGKCGRTCDAVEPDDKIEKLPTVSNIFLEKQENKERVILRNRTKLNEIIEKINND